jgi:hypothetical protein
MGQIVQNKIQSLKISHLKIYRQAPCHRTQEVQIPPCKRDNSKDKKAERVLDEDRSIDGALRLVSSQCSGTVARITDCPSEINLFPAVAFVSARPCWTPLLASVRRFSGASRQKMARAPRFRQMVARRDGVGPVLPAHEKGSGGE